MSDPEALSRVTSALAEIETQDQVRILLACESGSRAWGFASPESDYDVRFIYVHPRDWYLSVDDRRDVIERELPHDLDVSGWELRKALRLLRKSNPSLYEWLGSSIVYRRDDAFLTEFHALATRFFSPQRCFTHYLHMAEGNARELLQGRALVSLKKYLYIFRPLLACRWLERRLGPVPTLFQPLIDRVLEEPEVRAALEVLIARKRAHDVLAKAAPIPILAQFIEAELQRLNLIQAPDESYRDPEELNHFFRRWVLVNVV